MSTSLFPSPQARLLAARPNPRSTPFSAKYLCVRIRCSADAAQSMASTAAVDEDNVMETSTKKSSSSLISVENVQRALRGVAITTADHYGRLGLVRGCSYEQVTAAYESKRQELSSRELDEAEAGEQLALLKESYEILSSEDERRLYDWSLARSEKPDRYMWPFEVDITQTPTELPPPEEPEDVGPTRLVGYFMLAWLILSVVLSIGLSKL